MGRFKIKKYIEMKEIYYYKGKPYSLRGNSKIKLNGEWIDVVEYRCEYDNPDGMNWTRLASEFFELFKTKQ